MKKIEFSDGFLGSSGISVATILLDGPIGGSSIEQAIHSDPINSTQKAKYFFIPISIREI